MKNEKLLFAMVAVFGLILSHLLSGVKLPSGYDLGVVFTWVSVAGLLGFVAQFFQSAQFSYNVDCDFMENDRSSGYRHGIAGNGFYMHGEGTKLNQDDD